MKKIKDTSKALEKIDHEKVAKALGAELVQTSKNQDMVDLYLNRKRKMKTTKIKVSFEVTFNTDNSWEEEELKQLAEDFVSGYLPSGWDDKGLRFDIKTEKAELCK